MWTAGLVVGVLPLLIWVLRSFNEWRFCHPYLKSKRGGKLPPGHMGWPIIGELMDFLWCFKFTARPDDFIWKRKAKYGDTGIYRTYMFGYPSVITCSPEANRFATGSATEDGSFTAGWPSPQLMGQNGMGTASGAEHKRMRRYVMEAVNSPRSLKSIFIKTLPSFRAAFEKWVQKGTITAADEVNEVTFSIICGILFSFQKASVLENMMRIYKGLMDGIRSQPINLPGTAFNIALKCRKQLSDIISSEIEDRKVYKGRNSSKEDFLQNLMDTVDSNGDKLSKEEIVDNMVSLILAGYMSTSGILTWALYYLAKYPRVLQKLKEEITSIREKKGGEDLLTYEDVKSMTYTSKVIDEVIRLSNASAFIFRTVEKEEEFNGYIIPKGWKAIIWLRTNHVDSQYYNDPLEFRPERWDAYKPSPGVYHVFGSGPRQCPGSNLARLELLMFLYQLCLDYKWELENPHASIKYLPHPSVADGVKMKFSHI